MIVATHDPMVVNNTPYTRLIRLVRGVVAEVRAGSREIIERTPSQAVPLDPSDREEAVQTDEMELPPTPRQALC